MAVASLAAVACTQCAVGTHRIAGQVQGPASDSAVTATWRRAVTSEEEIARPHSRVDEEDENTLGHLQKLMWASAPPPNQELATL